MFFKTFIFFFLILTPYIANAQSKEDIFEYLKIRVEEFCANKESALSLNECQLKYNYTRTLQGNAPWTQERSLSLKNVIDVFFIYQDKTAIISLKLKDEAVIITDIEQDGQRNLVNYDNSIKLVFYKGTLLQQEGKKMAGLFKKLAKSCGAKIIEL